VDSIGEVLKNEKEFSEQQTVVIPYSWKFFIFGRKKVQSRNIQEKTDAFFVRWIDFLTVEILPHLILRALLLFDNRALTISYYKDLLPKFLFSQKVVNEDYRGLYLCLYLCFPSIYFYPYKLLLSFGLVPIRILVL
jgi:hypothetical protein